MIFREGLALSWQKRLRAWFWPRSGWKRTLQHLWKRIRRLNDTPYAIAAGFTLGVTVSFTPLLGLHVILALLLAWLVRGNIIAALLGTIVGNPITFPLIWALNYQIGTRISGAESQIPFDPDAVTIYQIGTRISGAESQIPFDPDSVTPGAPGWSVMDLFWTMLIGSVPVCLLLAILLYPATHWSVNIYQTKRQQTRLRRQHTRMRDKLPTEMEKS